MTLVRNSRWLLIVAVLLLSLAAIWIVRGAGSDSPAQAAPAAANLSGGESGWIGFDGILDQKTNLGHPAWSDAFSVRLASKLVPPENRWRAAPRGGDVTQNAAYVTKDIDGSAALPLDAQSDGPVSPNAQIQLIKPTNQSDGISIAVTMTGTVVEAAR